MGRLSLYLLMIHGARREEKIILFRVVRLLESRHNATQGDRDGEECVRGGLHSIFVQQTFMRLVSDVIHVPDKMPEPGKVVVDEREGHAELHS